MILVVVLLTVGFLALYRSAAVTFNEVEGRLRRRSQIDQRVLTGSTLLGLAMFTTLFLGTVLAVFLTLGAVRGDAERGLLQPLVVRPVGRTSLLLGRSRERRRCRAYVALVYIAAMLITGVTATGGRTTAGRPRAGLVSRWW